MKDNEIKSVVRQAANAKREYLAKYWKKNRKYLRPYRTAWVKEKRARSIPLIITGYFDPKTKTTEFTNVRFGRKYGAHKQPRRNTRGN